MAQRPHDHDSVGRREDNVGTPTTTVSANTTAGINVSNSVIQTANFTATEDHRQYHNTRNEVHVTKIIFVLPPGAYCAGNPGSVCEYLVPSGPRGDFGSVPPTTIPTTSAAISSEENYRQYVAVQPPLQPPQSTNILPNSNGIEYFRNKPISEKAKVYSGRQKLGENIFRDVAIKITKSTRRKLREVKNLVALTPHANVVAFIHSDTFQTVANQLYIVMEMCNPLTLKDYIMKRKMHKIPFNPTEAVEFSRQLIEGINHIHQNNIMHRDLKPSSVLFSVRGNSIKIIDFGMSKPLKRGLSVVSLSTLPIGVDGFRAPETYNRETITKESDIFSLAILLFHVWSYGYHPFDPIELWSHNIKELKPPVFARLLIPDGDCAKDLLRIMLVNNPYERANISDVRNNPFNTKAVNDTLTKSADALWTGPIEASTILNKHLDDCVLYKERHVVGAGIDPRWTLALNVVPGGISADTLQVPAEETPHGYLGVKRAFARCLKEKLKEEQSMAWIDISDHRKKKTRVLLIIRPKDYDELYGVLIRNPERFVSECQRNLGNNQDTIPKEPVGAAQGQQSSDESQGAVGVDSTAVTSQTSMQESVSAGGDGESEYPAESDDMLEDMTPREAEPLLNIPVGNLDLIPWWMHDPPSQ